VKVISKFGSLGNVLEIGFGDGALTKHLLPMADEYWGIEPGEDCFARTVKDRGINPEKAFCIKAEDMRETKQLMSRKNSFDLIILVSVLEHLSVPAQILETCHGLLKPGGRLFLSTPNSQNFKIFYGLRRLMGIDAWSVAHISFFKKSNLRFMFSHIGFDIDDIFLAPLITPYSIRYFKELYNSSLLGFCMSCFRRLRLDSLLNINTFNVVLTKKNN
jgi:2-polyprenyl-3-methyl-5-hydroxy-6-metoxy-1,4-benzoquinol methylase